MKAVQILTAAIASVAVSQLCAQLSFSATVNEQNLPQIVVRFGDLNLTSTDGANALMQRIADRRPEALADLYDRHAPMLLALATRILELKPGADGKPATLVDYRGTYEEYLAATEPGA